MCGAKGLGGGLSSLSVFIASWLGWLYMVYASLSCVWAFVVPWRWGLPLLLVFVGIFVAGIGAVAAGEEVVGVGDMVGGGRVDCLWGNGGKGDKVSAGIFLSVVVLVE